MKTCLILTAALAWNAAGAEEPPAPRAASTNAVVITPAFLNELADYAHTNNPALRAAGARVAAARANEQSVRRWDDPLARFGVMGADKEMRAEDGDLLYGIEQKLPVFGKPQAARRVAEAESRVESANAELQFQLLRRDIAQAVFRNALAQRRVEIGDEDLAWLETTLAAAEQRYQTGDASQVDVLRLQNERARRLTDLETDRQLAGHERVNLARLVGGSWPGDGLALRLPDVAAPLKYSARLAGLAARFEPRLKMLRQEITRAEAMAEQARRQRYPDLSVEAEARNYTGGGDFRQAMAVVSLSIPWGNRKRYEADFRRETARRQAAELDAADYELAVRNEVHDLTVRIDAARREALLYRDEIIPRSETALESAGASWQANRAAFRDLMDARRMLLEAQLQYARAVAGQYELLLEVVLCCGLGDLEALQMFDQRPAGQTQPEAPLNP